MTPRRAAWLAGGCALVVYLATLAPSVTFWDAGEFIAAARTFGIPHPPGTPLFVALLNTWARILSILPFATATNSFSAVCTALAVGLSAWLIARATRVPIAGICAAICAGAMTTVWLNATETEVYSASLLLSIAALAAGDRAGITGDARWTILSSYLLALALPLHLSALVAAPAVILLATDGVGFARWENAFLVFGATLIAAAISRLSPALVIVGVLCLVAAPFVARRRAAGARISIETACVIGIALSALAILVVRARFDPPINQGNPSHVADLGYVIARRQYEVAGLWPRQAPVWLQLANWFEYADWQFALGLGPTVMPTIPRVVVTLVYAFLGIVGARWHRRADPRSWRATLVLFACGSLGVMAYLNFKAGASFAWNIVPSEALHEARDRDYFFALGFWVWGLWAGMGALSLTRSRGVTWLGVAVAALPIVLNWRAVDRRSEPEASMPTMVASSLLEELPARAVLLVDGDNDTYPLWYFQQVQHRRRDVTVVTVPLLAAPWYLAELQRRNGLASGTSLDPDQRAAQVARSALALGRPVFAALTVTDSARRAIGSRWTMVGHSLRLDAAVQADVDNQKISRNQVINLDTAALRAAAQRVDAWERGRRVHPSVDPVDDYFSATLDCPRVVLSTGRQTVQSASLDSLCKPR